MINKAHELPVSRQAKLLKINRGTVCYLPEPVSPAEVALMRQIDRLHLEHPSWAPGCCEISFPAGLACGVQTCQDFYAAHGY